MRHARNTIRKKRTNTLLSPRCLFPAHTRVIIYIYIIARGTSLPPFPHFFPCQIMDLVFESPYSCAPASPAANMSLFCWDVLPIGFWDVEPHSPLTEEDVDADADAEGASQSSFTLCDSADTLPSPSSAVVLPSNKRVRKRPIAFDEIHGPLVLKPLKKRRRTPKKKKPLASSPPPPPQKHENLGGSSNGWHSLHVGYDTSKGRQGPLRAFITDAGLVQSSLPPRRWLPPPPQPLPHLFPPPKIQGRTYVFTGE